MSISELNKCSDEKWESELFELQEPWKPICETVVHLVEGSLWKEHPSSQQKVKRLFSLLYSDEKSELCQAALGVLQYETELSQNLIMAKAKYDLFCREQASIALQQTLLEKGAKKAKLAFQVGIENKCANCFLISVVQAICRLPNFRSCLKENKDVSKPISDSFFAMYEKLQRNELVLQDEMQQFRLLCSKEGLHTRGENTHEDAAEFCQFLLEKLGFPPFKYHVAVSHEVNAPFPSVENTRGETYLISLPLGEARDGADLFELMTANLVKEMLDPEAIFRSDSVALQDEAVLRKLQDLPSEPKLVNTLQAIQIESEKAPEIFIVALNRFNKDLQKISTRILPAQKIFITCGEKPNQEYELKAIVTHKGKEMSHGHYYTYVPSLEQWKEFNDEKVKTHLEYMTEKRAEDDPLAPHEDSTRNGYLYFYQICS